MFATITAFFGTALFKEIMTALVFGGAAWFVLSILTVMRKNKGARLLASLFMAGLYFGAHYVLEYIWWIAAGILAILALKLVFKLVRGSERRKVQRAMEQQAPSAATANVPGVEEFISPDTEQ